MIKATKKLHTNECSKFKLPFTCNNYLRLGSNVYILKIDILHLLQLSPKITKSKDNFGNKSAFTQ